MHCAAQVFERSTIPLSPGFRRDHHPTGTRPVPTRPTIRLSTLGRPPRNGLNATRWSRLLPTCTPKRHAVGLGRLESSQPIPRRSSSAAVRPEYLNLARPIQDPEVSGFDHQTTGRPRAMLTSQRRSQHPDMLTWVCRCASRRLCKYLPKYKYLINIDTTDLQVEHLHNSSTGLQLPPPEPS